MAYRLGAFEDVGLDERVLRGLIDRHEDREKARLEQLWAYYRNPPEGVNAVMGRRGRSAQERGLPGRITGSGDSVDGVRREVVVENDIAWRVQAMVDFMAGRGVRVESASKDERVARAITRALEAAWEASGGVLLLHDMTLVGHIYGHVDLVVRWEGSAARGKAVEGELDEELLVDCARRLRVELIEPQRGMALLSPGDYRTIDAYVVRARHGRDRGAQGHCAEDDSAGWMKRGLKAWRDRRQERAGVARGGTDVWETQVYSASAWATFEERGDEVRLTGEGRNEVSPGETPVVHIQHGSQPFCYEGVGEVEPLVALQDELNTRLSDRASRVTMQSFRMYLAKGLEGFEGAPIGPGRVWSTDNPDASVEAIGGDAGSPSEEAHIAEVREAMDKVSGVPPLAAGVVGSKIGNLTSENALRVTLQGLMSRTERKRVVYGRGIARASELMVRALEHAGVVRLGAEDRGVRVRWPDPLPAGESERVKLAGLKKELGVSAERVLAELGYDGEGIEAAGSSGAD